MLAKPVAASTAPVTFSPQPRNKRCTSTYLLPKTRADVDGKIEDCEHFHFNRAESWYFPLLSALPYPIKKIMF
jgi:hypothetical protein